MYSVYFAKSLKNGKIYVGRTGKDPKLRVNEHNKGSNNWSSQNKPFKLIYYESYHCLKDCIRRELFYKTGVGKTVNKLIVSVFDKI